MMLVPTFFVVRDTVAKTKPIRLAKNGKNEANGLSLSGFLVVKSFLDRIAWSRVRDHSFSNNWELCGIDREGHNVRVSQKKWDGL
jgi:hypothetical protein